jgi:hypothetical protein
MGFAVYLNGLFFLEEIKMAVKKVFYNDDVELDCYVNIEKKLFLSIKNEDFEIPTFITLDYNDTGELIDYLNDLIEDMK